MKTEGERTEDRGQRTENRDLALVRVNPVADEAKAAAGEFVSSLEPAESGC